MWDWLKADSLKTILQPRILFVIWFVGAFMLFAPSSVANSFGFSTVLNNYRGWIGIITLASFALWVAELVLWVHKRTQGKAVVRKKEEAARTRQEQTLQYINTLSPKEGFILAGCLALNQQTINLSAFEKPAAALRQKGLLEMATFGDAMNMPHTIPDFVWAFLQEHKNELLPPEGSEREAFKNDFRKFDSTATWRRSMYDDW